MLLLVVRRCAFVGYAFVLSEICPRIPCVHLQYKAKCVGIILIYVFNTLYGTALLHLLKNTYSHWINKIIKIGHQPQCGLHAGLMLLLPPSQA